jgi:hypothetical protein
MISNSINQGIGKNPLIDSPFFQQTSIGMSITPPPASDAFLLLDGDNFLLLSGEDFTLLE